MVSGTIRSHAVSRGIVFLFFASLVYSIWTATVGWNTPIMQVHSFRQTQTALTAHFIAEGGPILKYETPTLGPPWAIPFEFPLYQTIVAGVHKVSGVTLESAGRFVGKLFFYLSLFPLLLLGWQYGLRGAALCIPLTLYLLSPIYLYWSRQFMIESTATFFGLTYLAFCYCWVKRGGWESWALALAFGAVAALVKATSYACYALAVGVLFAHVFFSERKFSPKWIILVGVLLFFPLSVGLCWAKFTDHMKELNPLAGFITSAALKEWNFGTLAQRLSGDFWYKLFRQTIHDAIGHRTGWMLSVAIALAWGRRASLYWVFSLLFLVPPLIFTNLHIIHNYYANANAIFLVLAVAALCCQLLLAEKQWARVTGLVLLCAVSYYEVREFMRQPYYEQQVVTQSPVDLGAKIAEVVPKENVILVFGWDWDSTLAYFSRRRAIMARNVNWESPELAQSFANLAAEKRAVGAIVFCGGSEQNPQLFKNPHVGPRFFNHICFVHEFRN